MIAKGFGSPSTAFFSSLLKKKKSAQRRSAFCNESHNHSSICISQDEWLKKIPFSFVTLSLSVSSSAHLLLFRSFFFLHEWSLLIVHLITDRKPHATAVRRASSSCYHYLWWLPSGSSMNPDITSLYRYRLREVKKMVTNVTTFLL